MINGSFEGEYTERGYAEVKVAEGWEPFWARGHTPPPERPEVNCGRPEFFPARAEVDPFRVIDGAKAQGWYVRWRVMDAGVYQTFQVPANTQFTFSTNVQAWCSDGGDPRISDGELNFRLGLDLTGGIDPWASNVVWSNWLRGQAEYQKMEIHATSLTMQVTVFIRAWNKWELSHNDAYTDDAMLVIKGENEGNEGGLTEEDVRRIIREEVRSIRLTIGE